MTMTIIVVTIALCAIALLYFAVRSRYAGGQPARSIDLEAFAALLDRDDETFLRNKLSRREFVRLKRRRISMTMKYVKRIAGNSAAALQRAENSRQKNDAEAAQEAAQVIEMATQVRMHCMAAFAKLSAEYLFPSLQLTPAMLVPKYQALREKVLRLGSLDPQNAPLATAI